MKYLALETFRKDGQSVTTPMWFVERNGKIYMRTDEQSGKAHRIRNNSKITIAPCTARGTITGEKKQGHATLLPASDLPWLNDLIRRKYGFAKRLIDLFNRARHVKPIAIEIQVRASTE